MQTIITCPQFTDADALNQALEETLGQGARVYRVDLSSKQPRLAVHADGAMMEAALVYIREWLQNAAATGNNPPETVMHKVGEEVTYRIHTDSRAGYIESVSKNGRTVVMREAAQTLLNGVNSGEPDALTFTPGGFSGHTSGTQRWKVEPDPNGPTAKFTLRLTHSGKWIWKGVGTGTHAPGNVLTKGHHPHYDFNF